MRVTFYARVSTNTEEQKNSIESQVSFFQSYIKEKGYTKTDRGVFYKKDGTYTITDGYYVDEGYSGVKDYVTRKAFNRMIEDAKLKTFDLILVKDIRRFGRNVSQTLIYFEELKKYGVHVYIQDINANTGNPNDTILINLLATIAESESVSKSTSVQFGKLESYKKGKWGGKAPMGYAVKDGYLVINEEHAEVVKLIFDLYINSDMGLRGIAHELNSRGIKTQTGKTQWEATLISNILKNKIYTGKMVTHRTRKKDIKNNIVEKVPKSEQIEHQNELLRLISDEVFNEVQRIKEIRSKKYKDFALELTTKTDLDGSTKVISIRENTRHSSKHLLSGLVRCAYCGGRQRRKVIKKPSKTYTVWICDNYETYGKTRCSHRNMVHELELLDWMKESLDVAYISDWNRLFKAYLLDKYGILNVNAKEVIQSLEQQENKISIKIRKYHEMYATDKIKDEDYRLIIEEEELLRNNIRERLSKLVHREELLKEESNEYQRLQEKINSIEMNVVTNKELKEILSAIVVDKESGYLGLSYVWKFMNKTEHEILEGARLAIQKYKLKFYQEDDFYYVDDFKIDRYTREFRIVNYELSKDEIELSLRNLEFLEINDARL